MNRVIVVDKTDRVLGYKHREDMQKTDLYRVSCLWLTNSKGLILLSKRVKTKKHNPDKWEPAVAGTLEEGETYESNIIKETKEEIGLTVSPKELTIGPKIMLDGEWHFFGQFFRITLDQNLEDFVIAKDEVQELRWYHPDELALELNTSASKFVPNFLRIFNLFSSDK